MNVLMFSPSFPAEMVHFTRGLAEVGATVYGLGDHPPGILPEPVRQALSEYIHVRGLFSEDHVIEQVLRFAEHHQIDRVECLWEPGMLLAARLRQELGLDQGMSIEETLPFRDKALMKEMLDAAGLRTPRHRRTTSEAEVRAAAEIIGFPLIVKPIAGAGSADTYRVNDEEHLEEVINLTHHVPELSVEEFIAGEEYTFDTICSGGQVHYFNIAWYRPQPLIARTEEWISPQTISLRHVDQPELAPGLELGLAVLKALGFRTGFTHMEWFLTDKGEAVFGEIGARPPGARSVDIMNYASDIDVYTGWAEAVCHRRFSQKIERKYNAAVIFKRARGEGRIRHIAGLAPILRDLGPHITGIDLLPIGAMRRNWKQTLVSDGHIFLRHPDLASAMSMADRIGTDLQIFAG